MHEWLTSVNPATPTTLKTTRSNVRFQPKGYDPDPAAFDPNLIHICRRALAAIAQVGHLFESLAARVAAEMGR